MFTYVCPRCEWEVKTPEKFTNEKPCLNCDWEGVELKRNPTQLAPDKGQAAVVKDNLVSAPCG